MPATPLPPGETTSPRDTEARWVEPVFVEPVPAPREPVRWREVGWVEFSAAEETAREQEARLWFVSRVASPAAPSEPELVEPVFAYSIEDVVERDRAPSDGREDQDEIAVYLSDSYEYEYQDNTVGYLPHAPKTSPHIQAEEESTSYYFHEEEAFSEDDATTLYIPEDDGSLELYAPALDRHIPSADRRRGLARLLDFARNGVQGLSRVAIAAGILLALAALSYYGGEHVAGLAGAMTPPQNTAASTASAALDPPLSAAPAHTPAPAPIEEDAARAAAFLDKAKAGDMAAQYKVALAYASGKGLARDFTSAAAWFAKAAEAGSSSAQFNLGVMYQRGLGMRQDTAQAFRWYRHAADRHYAPAEFNLAVAYAEGQGTPADPVAAARWYHQAATQGLIPAMINFAILYEKGEGVERSPADAYAWYRAAAQRGDAVGEKRAGELWAQFDVNKKRTAQSQAANIANRSGNPRPS